MSYNFLQKKADAFPPAKPFPPYKFPALTREGTLTQFVPTKYDIHTGKRVPLVVRTVTVKGLVKSVRFVLAIWHRLALVRPVRPPQTLLPHSTILKPGVSPHGASKGRREFDPYGDFAFHVEIGSMRMAFSKFDGIDVEIDQIEYKDSLDTHPHKRPGIHRFGNIKLSKGVIADKQLWDWIHSTMAGDLKRLNGSIHVLSDNHDKTKPEITYHFYQAWPCKWSGLRLDGKGTGTMVEELELAVDYISRGK